MKPRDLTARPGISKHRFAPRGRGTIWLVTASGRWDCSAAIAAMSRPRQRSISERLFSLLENAPILAAVLEGPNRVFVVANAAYREQVSARGHPDVVGLSFDEAYPTIDEELRHRLDRVYATGERFIGRALWRERYYDYVLEPLRDAAGRVTGVVILGTDVTEREQLIRRQRLLLHELSHRVKNNLATVQSIAFHTAREARDVTEFMTDFEGRLIALARTHEALAAQDWGGAELGELVKRELTAFEGRIQLSGPAMQLNPAQAQAISLITHELASNASRYGALACNAGWIELEWADEGARFKFEWNERGGPSLQPPHRRGFGTRLIERLVKGDLGGAATTVYEPEGLQFRLSAPKDRGSSNMRVR